jgi:hypothetical protein
VSGQGGRDLAHRVRRYRPALHQMPHSGIAQPRLSRQVGRVPATACHLVQQPRPVHSDRHHRPVSHRGCNAGLAFGLIHPSSPRMTQGRPLTLRPPSTLRWRSVRSGPRAGWRRHERPTPHRGRPRPGRRSVQQSGLLAPDLAPERALAQPQRRLQLRPNLDQRVVQWLPARSAAVT